MNLYLIGLTDEQAAELESMLGDRIEIVPSRGPLNSALQDPGRAVLSSCDAAGFDGELADVAHRLATSGPRYHQGGPQATRAAALRLRAQAGPDPYGGLGIRVGGHWEPPIGWAASDKALGLEPAEDVSEPPYIQEEGGGIDLRNLTRPQPIEYEPQPALATCCPGGEPYYTDTAHHADGSRCWHRPQGKDAS